jgi:Mrp family chromosome partitioning ATPase/capsular polysaccharide biosynthesis protein
MDLLSYFRVLRRRWLLIVVLTVVGGVIGAASTQLEKSDPKTRTYYKATNTLYFDSSSNNGSSGFQSAFQNLDQIAVLVTTGDVPDAAAKALGSDEPGRSLAEHIVTTTNGSTNTIDITAAEPNADQAVATADAFSKALIDNLTARDLERYNAAVASASKRIDGLKAQSNTFLTQLAANPNDPVARAQYDSTANLLTQANVDFGQLTAQGAPVSRLSVLQSAESVPINSGEYDARLNLGALGQNHVTANTGTENTDVITGSSDSTFKGPVSRGLLGALLGLLAGIGLALLLERLDHRIRSREQAEAAFGMPVLAEVPRLTKAQERDNVIISYSDPLSRTAEAFRAVRSSLLFQRAALAGSSAPVPGASGAPEALFEPEVYDPFVVMVTSAAPRESKTTTTANLAAVFAEAGSSVLVVNCDFRRPTLHRFFGLPDEPRRVHDTMVPGVKVVTNVLSDPSPNPAQVVAAQRHVVAAAHGRFDVILLDTAPLLSANDAVELVGSADLVLLTAKIEVTTSDDATRAVDLLGRLGAPLGGVVLAGASDAPSDYYYYASSPGGRGGRTDRDAAPSARNGNGASTNGAGTNGAGANGASGRAGGDLFTREPGASTPTDQGE